MSGATLVWAEGRPGWEALQDVPELWAEAAAAAIGAAAASTGAPGAAAAAPASGQAGSGPGGARAAPAKAVRAAKAVVKPVDRELAAFQVSHIAGVSHGFL